MPRYGFRGDITPSNPHSKILDSRTSLTPTVVPSHYQESAPHPLISERLRSLPQSARPTISCLYNADCHNGFRFDFEAERLLAGRRGVNKRGKKKPYVRILPCEAFSTGAPDPASTSNMDAGSSSSSGSRKNDKKAGVTPKSSSTTKCDAVESKSAVAESKTKTNFPNPARKPVVQAPSKAPRKRSFSRLPRSIQVCRNVPQKPQIAPSVFLDTGGVLDPGDHDTDSSESEDGRVQRVERALLLSANRALRVKGVGIPLQKRLSDSPSESSEDEEDSSGERSSETEDKNTTEEEESVEDSTEGSRTSSTETFSDETVTESSEESSARSSQEEKEEGWETEDDEDSEDALTDEETTESSFTTSSEDVSASESECSVSETNSEYITDSESEERKKKEGVTALDNKCLLDRSVELDGTELIQKSELNILKPQIK